MKILSFLVLALFVSGCQGALSAGYHIDAAWKLNEEAPAKAEVQ